MPTTRAPNVPIYAADESYAGDARQFVARLWHVL
jgi:hypothetical protein